MSRVLVVADSSWVVNDVHAALSLPGYEIIDHNDPDSVVDELTNTGADVAVVDFQVATMGGMAITRAIRDAPHPDERARVPVILLLDRAADAFLARRAGADAWVQKPFTATSLRDAVNHALAARESSPT